MKCPHCGKEIKLKDLVILDRDSVRVIAQNMMLTVLYYQNQLGEKIDCRR